jgi:hypothetical protein
MASSTAVSTDRVLIKLNGEIFAPYLKEFTFTMNNNAKIEETMSQTRTSEVITYGNINGDSTITEVVTQGGEQTDWLKQDVVDAILEVHPASNSWQAPAQMVVYNGQVRILRILAVNRIREDYSGSGQAGTRVVDLLISEVDYA